MKSMTVYKPAILLVILLASSLAVVAGDQAVVFDASPDLRAQHQLLRRVANPVDTRNAELAGDNGGMTGTPATIGDNGSGFFHYRFPVRIRHIRYQHVPFLHLRHLRHIGNDFRRPRADTLSNGATGNQQFS